MPVPLLLLQLKSRPWGRQYWRGDAGGPFLLHAVNLGKTLDKRDLRPLYRNISIPQPTLPYCRVRFVRKQHR